MFYYKCKVTEYNTKSSRRFIVKALISIIIGSFSINTGLFSIILSIRPLPRHSLSVIDSI